MNPQVQSFLRQQTAEWRTERVDMFRGDAMRTLRLVEALAHVGDHLADGRRLVLQRALKKHALNGGVVDANRDRVFVNVETNDDVCNRISRTMLIHRTVPFGAIGPNHSGQYRLR